MHFIFPGRMALIDLPYEAVRVARLLDRHGISSLHGVRLRAYLLERDATITLADESGELLEVLEVPPLELCLSSGKQTQDGFETQQFEIRSRFETRLKEPFRRLTGPDRGPAAIDRISGS